MREDEADLIDLMKILVARWKVLVIVTIVAAIFGFSTYWALPLKYISNSTLMVVRKNNVYSQLSNRQGLSLSLNASGPIINEENYITSEMFEQILMSDDFSEWIGFKEIKVSNTEKALVADYIINMEHRLFGSKNVGISTSMNEYDKLVAFESVKGFFAKKVIFDFIEESKGISFEMATTNSYASRELSVLVIEYLDFKLSQYEKGILKEEINYYSTLLNDSTLIEKTPIIEEVAKLRAILNLPSKQYLRTIVAPSFPVSPSNIGVYVYTIMIIVTCLIVSSMIMFFVYHIKN